MITCKANKNASLDWALHSKHPCLSSLCPGQVIVQQALRWRTAVMAELRGSCEPSAAERALFAKAHSNLVSAALALPPAALRKRSRTLQRQGCPGLPRTAAHIDTHAGPVIVQLCAPSATGRAGAPPTRAMYSAAQHRAQTLLVESIAAQSAPCPGAAAFLPSTIDALHEGRLQWLANAGSNAAAGAAVQPGRSRGSGGLERPQPASGNVTAPGGMQHFPP